MEAHGRRAIDATAQLKAGGDGLQASELEVVEHDFDGCVRVGIEHDPGCGAGDAQRHARANVERLEPRRRDLDAAIDATVAVLDVGDDAPQLELVVAERASVGVEHDTRRRSGAVHVQRQVELAAERSLRPSLRPRQRQVAGHQRERQRLVGP
ncbi:MAG: hypothetical protein IPN32_15850 [Deltaproteobacteria bacterium]|nr:hypothetical protein [Deltaproteobacteria bacterium]